jgi:hypothetical protein
MRGTNVNIEILWSVAKGPHLERQFKTGRRGEKALHPAGRLKLTHLKVLIGTQTYLLAQSRHTECAHECPLLEAKRMCARALQISKVELA